MLRTEISSLAGYGNALNSTVDIVINEINQEEQANSPRWFGMVNGTVLTQDPAILVNLILLAPPGATPFTVFKDQDGFTAVVTALIPFEQTPPKFQEFIGYKTALRLLREQGAGEEDLKDLEALKEAVSKEIGALQLAYRSILCTRELAVLRNRVLQHGGMPGMGDYSETAQGWQIENLIQKTLDTDPVLLATRDIAGVLLKYVAEYVVLKTLVQIKPDEEANAKYLKARADLVGMQARIGNVKDKYLRNFGTYFNTRWATLSIQNPLTLANGATILASFSDPNGNLSKIHVDVAWTDIPGQLKSLILLEEAVEDRAIRNDLSPVLQSEIILLDSRRKAWAAENNDKMNPPVPERELGKARNLALVYLGRPKQGEYCADNSTFALEEYIDFASSQIMDLIPDETPPYTFEPMWQYVALEAAKAINPDLRIHNNRIAAYYTTWITKWVPRDKTLDLRMIPLTWTPNPWPNL